VRDLRIGEEVIGQGGRRLGHVERLVVDEQAHRVTHVEIDGRLVGVGHFREADGGRLTTDLDAEGLRRQPEAHAPLVEPPGRYWRPPGGYALGNFLRIASALIGQAAYVPPVRVELDLSGVHEIAPGSPVWSRGKQVGEVSEVLSDDDGTVRSLVVRRPGLLGPRLLLPSEHVVEVLGINVYTDLTEPQIEALPHV
jgi:sporulation protein YlmC with PRC-barrel domain